MVDPHETMGSVGQIAAERDALQQRLDKADCAAHELQRQLDLAKTLMTRLLAASYASTGKPSAPLTNWGLNEIDVVEREMACFLNPVNEAGGRFDSGFGHHEYQGFA
ncbi:hypothetical protein BJ917_5263 [Pseudomonas sp. WPR_5_2]|uniref:hypothetical protein n=1 Tax=Pseudomonas sp. WPR_5_2 TaxID=1907371 RepID=UPI000EAE500D|nr:hypothetical protein [Pseudomonas sp. WPR_5_2]RKS17103.1 hypothetical protein BJ917_5263 [Pseudomonas sp. WPR_5_2]